MNRAHLSLAILGLSLTLSACGGEQTKTVTTESTSSITSKDASGMATFAKPVDEQGCLITDLALPTGYRGKPLKDICNTSYNVAYDSASHVARAVSEQIVDLQLRGNVTRSNDFRDDPRMGSGAATLDTYRGSGYDRGHLAPAADFPYDKTAMSSSFLLSNVAPQNPDLNQGPWAGLESATRACAKQLGTLTVITGTLGRTGTLKNSQASIPSAFYKLWYSKANSDYRLWVMPNTSVDTLSGSEFSTYEVPLYQFREFWPDFPQTGLDEDAYGGLCPGAIPLTKR